jgi:hypothetical protein
LEVSFHGYVIIQAIFGFFNLISKKWKNGNVQRESINSFVPSRTWLILIGIPTNKQADKPANKPFNKPAIE